MTKSTITRERIKQYAHDPHMCNVNEDIRELACMALAALDSEPVFFIEVEGDDWINAGRIPGSTFDFNNLPDGINNLYATPQPAPELTATVERLNASGYEYEGGEVTPQNVAAVVDILLQQLDDAVQGRDTQPAPVVLENCVTAEHRRVIEMLLNVCGAAFELADDSCQQDVDGEDCHVVPNNAFQKLSDMLDEIENSLPTEDADRPDVFLAWAAMPRASLKSLLQAGNSPVIPDDSADTKRLDWLDAQNKRLNEYYGTSYGWKFDANFQRNAMMLNDSNYPVMTVRQAIDESIAAAPKQGNI